MTLILTDIRRADLAEAATIADVHKNAWEGTYRGIIPQTRLDQMIARRGQTWWHRALKRETPVIVLEFDTKIVGYATIGFNRAKTLPHDGEIYELYILPEYQGVGLGRKLLLAARRKLRENGLKSHIVWVLDDNETATHFYKNAGASRIARSTETFGDKILNKSAYAWGA